MGYAIKDAANLVITDLADETKVETIDYLNSFNIKLSSESVEAKKKGNVAITFSGSRTGTVQMDAEVIDDNFLSHMFGGTVADGKITVTGKIPNKYYKITGEFVCVNEDGSEEIKTLTFTKAQPTVDADVTLDSTAVSSFSLIWNIMVDDNDLLMEVGKKTV